jgi:hypothetical protein
MPTTMLAFAMNLGKLAHGSLNSAAYLRLHARDLGPTSLKSLNSGKSRRANRGLRSVFVNGVKNMCRVPGPSTAAPILSPRPVTIE